MVSSHTGRYQTLSCFVTYLVTSSNKFIEFIIDLSFLIASEFNRQLSC